MKAVVAAFNQEKALVRAFSVITNLWMDLFEALMKAVVIMNIAGGIIAVIIGTPHHFSSKEFASRTKPVINFYVGIISMSECHLK